MKSAKRMFEPLETRTLRSVTVEDLGLGRFEVQGDAFGNVIHVSLDHANKVLKVNADSYPNAAYVEIFGNGGNDSVDVTSVRPTDTPYIGVAVNGGPGDDVLTMGVGCDGGLFGDDGADYLGGEGSFRLQAYGGPGPDKIVLTGWVPDGDFRGEDGDDTIDAQAATVPVALYGGNGSDRLYGGPKGDILDGQLGVDYVYGRAGNDTIYANDGYRDYISGGDDYDVAFVDHEYYQGPPREAVIGGVEDIE